MPITGHPDPEKHKICCRCGQWHEPYEGSAVLPPKAGPLAQIGRTVAGVEGFGMTERFMCHACQKRLTRQRIWIILAIFLAILILVLLFALGGISFFQALRSAQ